MPFGVFSRKRERTIRLHEPTNVFDRGELDESRFPVDPDVVAGISGVGSALTTGWIKPVSVIGQTFGQAVLDRAVDRVAGDVDFAFDALKMIDSVFERVTPAMMPTDVGADQNVISPVMALPKTSPVPDLDMSAAANIIPDGEPPPGDSIDQAINRADQARVNFTPFRINLYDRSKHGPLDSAGLSAGLDKIMLQRGKYLFTFRAPLDAPFGSLGSVNPVEIDVWGKKIIIEKYHWNTADNFVRVQIDIIDNPLPVVPIVLGIAGLIGLGIAGWGMADSLEQVDKIIVDTGGLMPMVVLGGLAFLAYKVFW